MMKARGVCRSACLLVLRFLSLAILSFFLLVCALFFRLDDSGFVMRPPFPKSVQ